MSEWFAVEVLDGPGSARLWKGARGDAIVATAAGHGAEDWEWHEFRWGVVFEVRFTDEDGWERFCADPAVRVALDAVPDPVGGLSIHRGRGGSAGVRGPRRPRPIAGAGAVALPLPEAVLDDLVADVMARRVLACP